MSESKENEAQIETAEDLAAEEKHLGEVKEDDVRKEIISEYGFDPEDDKDKGRIDKLVAREMEGRKNLSKAIGQKRKYRDQLKGNDGGKEGDEGKGKKTPQNPASSEKDTEDFDKKLDSALDKRQLKESEYPDEIKNVIANVMKYNDVSFKNAVKDPYVAAKIEAWEKTQDAEGASISRNNKAGGVNKGSAGDDLTPPDVDLNTKEGREEYDAWKDRMIKEGH